MNYEEKLAVLQSLQPRAELLRMLGPGAWRCSLPGAIDRECGGYRKNTVVRQNAFEAVEACFALLEELRGDEALRIIAGLSAKFYRWSGTCWVEVHR